MNPKGEVFEGVIDYIFHSKNFTNTWHEVTDITECLPFENEPSDHIPIFASFI